MTPSLRLWDTHISPNLFTCWLQEAQGEGGENNAPNLDNGAPEILGGDLKIEV